MSIYGGPDIEIDGLVFHLDTGNRKSYPSQNLEVEYLIVAGGGGGGGVIGGGGGAGGLLNGFATAILATGTYSVVVGAGGAGGTGWNTGSQNGKVGSNSSALSVTSNGGGGGRHYGGSTTSTTVNGGSGGGGANGGSGGGTGINGQGNNGGGGGTYNVGAGGGGAGTSGGNASHSFNLGGHGGLGKYFGNKFGSVGYNGWFADGGGGGVRYNRTRGLGSNGAGDGGNHNNDTLTSGITNAVINTGSGGGGAGYSGGNSNRIGGNGGSGVVIIKYKGSQKASGGDSIYTYNGFTVHLFTSSGTFTIGNNIGGLSTQRKSASFINMNTSNFVNDRKGYLTFDGTNEYLSVNAISGDFTNFTVIAWFYPQSLTNYENVLDCNYNVYTNSGNIGPRLEINSNKQLIWLISGNTTTNNSKDAVYSRTTNQLVANQWCCAALTKNGTTLKAYFNGQLIQTTTNTNGFVNSFGNLVIGKGFHLGGAERAFTGNVASVKTYTKAFTDKQIFKNFNALKGRFGL